jgi:hypothetical protein
MKCALIYSRESGKAMIYFFVHAFLPEVWVVKGSAKLRQTICNIYNRGVDK